MNKVVASIISRKSPNQLYFLFYRLLWFLVWLLLPWPHPSPNWVMDQLVVMLVVLSALSLPHAHPQLRKLKSNLVHPLPKTSAPPPMLSAKKSPTRRGTLTHFLQSQILTHFVIFEQVSIHFKTLIHGFYSILQSFTCPDLI